MFQCSGFVRILYTHALVPIGKHDKESTPTICHGPDPIDVIWSQHRGDVRRAALEFPYNNRDLDVGIFFKLYSTHRRFDIYISAIK